MAIRPAGEVQLKNSTLEVLLLPKNSRATTRVDITVGTSAAEADSVLQLSAPTDTPILAGTSLSFLDGSIRKHALITEDITVTSTPAPVPVDGLIDSIASGSIAQFVVGLLPVFGIQEFSFGAQPQEVDTTNTQSGYGMESALVRSDKTIDISGIQIPGDKALYTVIKQVAVAGARFGREIYAVFTYPDGQIYRGAAKIKNYSEPGNQNEVKKYSFQLQYQGNNFEYIEPRTF